MNIPNGAIDAAKDAGDAFGLELTTPDLEKLLEAAAPLIAAQALNEAAQALPPSSTKPRYEHINYSHWLRARAARIGSPNQEAK